MTLEEIGKLADETLCKHDKSVSYEWLNKRRTIYNKHLYGTCKCGKAAIKQYQPFCSYLCSKK